MGNMVMGNKVGTNMAGSGALPNAADGVHISNAGSNIVGGPGPSEGNLISGNGGDGVFIGGPSPSNNNLVSGNLIGTNAAGTAPLGNTGQGVHISNMAMANVIGGHTAEEANVISGNSENGVQISLGGARNNEIARNLIGTNATGTAAIPNMAAGINIWGGRNNRVGATPINPDSGNVISGNTEHGVYIHSFTMAPFSFATENQVAGNKIGTAMNGTDPLGNGMSGVLIESTPNNIIGLTGGGPLANVISANQAGVHIKGLQAAGNQVVANLIGTDATGMPSDPTSILGNALSGVLIEDTPSLVVGGELAGQANTIAGNGEDGVRVTGATALGNRIQQNSIFSNTLLGIDLGGDGVTPRDMFDPDSDVDLRDLGIIQGNFGSSLIIPPGLMGLSSDAKPDDTSSTVVDTVQTSIQLALPIQFTSLNVAMTADNGTSLKMDASAANRETAIEIQPSPANRIDHRNDVATLDELFSGNRHHRWLSPRTPLAAPQFGAGELSLADTPIAGRVQDRALIELSQDWADD